MYETEKDRKINALVIVDLLLREDDLKTLRK
jgi:hypothetical protein